MVKLNSITLLIILRITLITALCSILLLSGFSVKADADNEASTNPISETVLETLSQTDTGEYDGFLIGISKDFDISGCGLDYVAEGIYKAESLSKISEFMLSDYIQADDVEYIEPNYYIELPDNEFFDRSLKMSSTYTLGPETQSDVTLFSKAAYDGTNVRIAVIDSGLNLDYGDFETDRVERYTIYPDNILYDPLLIEKDKNHGTYVADIIAGIPNNGIGLDGIAPGATIVSIKVFTRNADNKATTTYEAIITAIDRAVYNYNCDIINLSFGGTTHDQSLYNIIQDAVSKGVIIVAASGNYATTTSNPVVYPAAYEGVISVGAVGTKYVWQSYSTYNSYVDCAALGEYFFGSGTSFAAPAVAAAAAIIKQTDSFLTPGAFESLLQKRCMDLGISGRDDKYGYGFVRLDWLMSTAPVIYDKITADSVTTLSVGVFSPDVISIIRALYTTDGRLISIDTLLPTNFCVQYNLEEEKIRLFFLSSGFSPLSNSITY